MNGTKPIVWFRGNFEWPDMKKSFKFLLNDITRVEMAYLAIALLSVFLMLNQLAANSDTYASSVSPGGASTRLRLVDIAECVDYDKGRRAITISCNLNVSDISLALNNTQVIKKEPTEEAGWFLNSSIVVKPDATLTLNDTWLKIESYYPPAVDKEDIHPHRIEVYGALEVDNAKITSWNSTTNNYERQYHDGRIPRPYIIVRENASASSITDSELAYLGYNNSRAQGLNFYGGDGTNITNDEIHDLWYGFYSDNLGDTRIENNLVYNNTIYGIDPHTGSHDMIVRNNTITNSSSALVCSYLCYNILFEDNQIHNNDKIGILLSRNLTDTVVRNNNISETRAGISITKSHDNAIYNNTIVGSEFPIALKAGAANNTIVNNKIIDSMNCAILAYQLAEHNNITGNQIAESKKDGLCVNQGAKHNIFYSNMIDSVNRFGISVRGQDAIDNIFENNIVRLAKEGIMVSNNTDTSFVNNLLNEIISNEYTISANSTLNLDKSPSSNYKIKSTGTVENVVRIEDSGKIDVFFANVKESGAEEVGSRFIYDSDVSPYIERIMPATILEVN
jgi:mannuronan 5-epimerase